MKEIEVIAQTETLRVRIMALEPRVTAEWHYHSEVTDHIFCLTGVILVSLKDPEESVALQPGQRCIVEIRRLHQIRNKGNSEATYLLIQGMGKYDFNLIQ